MRPMDYDIPAALREALDAEFPQSTGPVITALIKADRARAMAAMGRFLAGQIMTDSDTDTLEDAAFLARYYACELEMEYSRIFRKGGHR